MNAAWQLIQENWFAAILGIVALGVAIYELFKRQGPRLSYQFTSQRIVGRLLDPLPAQVSIQFEGQPVEHLSKTEIILWNSGPAALRRADIPPTDPLKVSFKNSRILMCDVTKVIRESSAVVIDISEDRAYATISFEYLDKNDGALLTFWQDGVDTTPQFSGVIIGQNAGIASLGRFRSFSVPDVPPPTPVGRIESFLIRHRKLTRFPLAVPWIMIGAGALVSLSSIFRDQLEDAFPVLYAKVDEEN